MENVGSLIPRGNQFAGNFQQKLQDEVARRETLAKSEFRSSDRYRPRPQRPRETRPAKRQGNALENPRKVSPAGQVKRKSWPAILRGVRGSTRGNTNTTRSDRDRASTRLSFIVQPSAWPPHLGKPQVGGGENSKSYPAMGIYGHGQVVVENSIREIVKRIYLRSAFRGWR